MKKLLGLSFIILLAGCSLLGVDKDDVEDACSDLKAAMSLCTDDGGILTPEECHKLATISGICEGIAKGK